MTRKHTNNRMQEKPNNFELKYDKQETITKKKSRIDKQYDKRIKKSPRRSESGNTHRFKKQHSKYIKLKNSRPWWNTWILIQEIHLHSRKTCTRNEQMSTRSTHTWMDDQKSSHIDPEETPQGNRPKNYRPITFLLETLIHIVRI